MGETDWDAEITTAVVDAIEALGHRHRLQILFALAAAEWEQRRQWHAMTFTELHDAVDVESSSRFSYHLDRLVDQFVCETPDGYRLTYSGEKIVRTVRSGSYESTSAFTDRPVDGVCLLCDQSSLVAALQDEQFVVRCDGCDSVLVTDFFPRSQARDRTPEAVVASFGHRIWSSCVMLRGSVCPECYAPVETEIETHERAGETLYTHASTCRECMFTVHVPVEVAATFHPTAMRALWDHGVSLLDVPLWELFEYLASDRIVTEAVSKDPLELECTLSLDDSSLSFAIDDTVRARPLSVPDR